MSNRTPRRSLAFAMLVVAISACDRHDPTRHVASAQKSLAEADYKTAIMELKSALRGAPNQADARFLLAKALLVSGHPRDAETEARKALDLDYPADDALPLLLRALLAEGEYEKVVAEPHRQLTRPAARADVETTRALAYLAMKDSKSTRAAIAAALAADPSYQPAKIAQVRLAMMESDLPGALALVNTILAATPSAIEPLVLKAELQGALGQRDEGVRTMERALEVKPEDVTIRSAFIDVLVKAGRIGDADRHLAELKRSAPNHPRTWYSEALLAYSRGNMPAAQAAIERVRHLEPSYLSALYLSGLIDMRLESYASAEAALRIVVAKMPEDEDARRSLATIYVRRGNASQALTTLEPLLRRSPDDPSLLRAVAEIHLASNNTGKAAEYFAKADKLDSGSVAGRIRLAQFKLANGDTDQAVKDLEALAASEPVVPDPDLALIDAYVQQRDFEKASAAVARLAKKQPSIAATHNAKGLVYMAREDRKNARTSFEKAVSLDPDYAAAALNLAKLDLLDRNYDGARKLYEQVLAKEPQSESALLALAELLVAMKAPAGEVTATIWRAAVAKPRSVQPWLALIDYNRQQQDWKAANENSQRALWWLPDDPQIIEALAMVQFQAGETNQAIESLRRAVRMRSGSPAPLLRLAELQIKIGDSDGAVKSLQAGIDRQPDLPDTWMALADIYAKASRIQAGMDSARRLQKERPERAGGFALEGELYARLQKWTESAAAFRVAMTRQATPYLVMRLHAMLWAEGKADEANRVALQWIKGHPTDVDVRGYLAEKFMGSKDYRAAATQLSSALKYAPDNSLLLNNLGRSLSELGDPKAVEYAARAHALAPTNAEVADTYGRLLVAQGDAVRGAELLRQAVDLAPRDADKRMRLARALSNAGNNRAARQELEIIVKMEGAPSVRAEAEKLLREQ